MARKITAPFAVRPTPIALIIASFLIGATTGGCSHRRSSMRPVYGTPVSSPTIVTPTAPQGIITTDPEVSEPILAPVPSASNSDNVIRAGGSPPVAPEAEPGLNEPVPPTPGASSNNPGGIELTRPSALRSTGRTVKVPGRTTRGSLRQAVTPYVADPTDLFQPPKADRPWKYVVVHHSANSSGGLDQIDRDHRKILGFEGCGYHFVIGNGTDSPDGQIEVAPRWINQKNGVHCRNGKNPDVNEYGIGICLVGNFDDTKPTPRQVAAAKALVAYLSERYQIPTDHVGAHDQFSDSPTACPGTNFPAQAIFGTNHVATR